MFFYTVGPGRRLNILKGSATLAGGAVVGCLSNLYTVKGGISCKLLMWSGLKKHRVLWAAIQKLQLLLLVVVKIKIQQLLYRLFINLFRRKIYSKNFFLFWRTYPHVCPLSLSDTVFFYIKLSILLLSCLFYFMVFQFLWIVKMHTLLICALYIFCQIVFKFYK